jgi:hypothetical protein
MLTPGDAIAEAGIEAQPNAVRRSEGKPHDRPSNHA